MTLLWWSRALSSELTGLARVLFARTGAEIDPDLFMADRVTLPADDKAADFLAPVFAPLGDAVALTVTGRAEGVPRRWAEQAPAPRPGTLELAVLDRVLPRAERRWSFSALSDRARAARDRGDDTLVALRRQ